MQLSTADWLVIVVYFALNLAIGLLYYRRASGSMSEFFVSGRNVPWWLAGTSMVATTFAADTPLAVTGMVVALRHRRQLAVVEPAAERDADVFFFARLWRRAGVLTDIEFAELRYAAARRLPARLPRALPGLADQLHHPGLGKPGDGEDPGWLDRCGHRARSPRGDVLHRS